MAKIINRSRGMLLLLFVSAVLFIIYDATHAADEAREQIRQETTRLKEQRTTIQKNEAAISQALERSRKALAATRQRGDQESVRVVQGAVAEAQESLDTVQNLRVKLEMRIRVLENAVRVAPQGREFGVATMVIGNAQVFRKAGVQPLESGGMVSEEELVSTGRSAFCELYLPDASYVMLGPESAVTVTEVDRANRIVMADLKKGKVHIEKTCAENEASRCWAARYSTGGGFVSFGGAELVIEQRVDGTEVITVLDGAAVFRDKRTRKALTLQVGDQLVAGKSGETVSLKRVGKDDVQSWWDPDIRVRM